MVVTGNITLKAKVEKLVDKAELDKIIKEIKKYNLSIYWYNKEERYLIN